MGFIDSIFPDLSPYVKKKHIDIIGFIGLGQVL
jgi:hypothetical protein